MSCYSISSPLGFANASKSTCLKFKIDHLYWQTMLRIYVGPKSIDSSPVCVGVCVTLQHGRKLKPNHQQHLSEQEQKNLKLSDTEDTVNVIV